jgi:peptidoglycan/xylan/chitin deacetylase (PgdA/CDA1 family)
MRLDRQLTTAVFHPLARAAGELQRLSLPVLMYHNLTSKPEKEALPYYRINTSPAVFRGHIEQLARGGCRSIDFDDVVAWLQGGPPLPEKSVVITFDDAYRNIFTEAFPVLQKHGLTATVFLPTAFVGDKRLSFKGSECMIWAEAREMQRHGFQFGSHTVNHPELLLCSRREVERELKNSKTEIEHELGAAVSAFAYPGAFPQGSPSFVRDFRRMLVQAGYHCCVTTQIGRVKAEDDPFRLKRLPINSLDDARLFQAKLEGGYDWLAVPQKAFKTIKGSLHATRLVLHGELKKAKAACWRTMEP